MDIINLLLKRQGALISAYEEAKENPDDLTDEEYFGSDDYYETSIQLIGELIAEIKEEEAGQ
jgi:hypothetical protein